MNHALLAGLAGLVLLAACRLPNPEHCVHKHVDSDAWCAAHVEGRPFCSPCVAEGHGCVADAPDEAACPAYEPDSTGDDSGASSSSGTSG